MSGVGFDSTEGNKKSNYHFQLSLLQTQGQIQTLMNQLIAAIGGSGATTTPFGPITTTTSGTIPQNAKTVSIANTGAANGTVNGNTLASGLIVTWHGPIVAAVSYNATGTQFTISYEL